MMKKIVSLLIALSLVVSGLASISTVSSAKTENKPTVHVCGESRTASLPADIDTGAWYYQNVKNMLDRGIMQGVGDNRFDPEGGLTRAQVATILYRLEKDTLPKVAEAVSFRDVRKGDWFYEAVCWASETQVIGGYEDHTFRPNQLASREEVVTMIVRCFHIAEADVSDVNLGRFSDKEDIQNYALVPMKYAVKNGWILGGEKNDLNPNATMTRAEMAAFTDRVFFTKPVEPDTTEEPAESTTEEPAESTTEEPSIDEGEPGENELPIH